MTEETGAPMPLDELAAVLDVIRAERGAAGLEGFDVMIADGTPADASEALQTIAPYDEAGMTWWSEGLNGWRGPLPEMLDRCAQDLRAREDGTRTYPAAVSSSRTNSGMRRFVRRW